MPYLKPCDSPSKGWLIMQGMQPQTVIHFDIEFQRQQRTPAFFLSRCTVCQLSPGPKPRQKSTHFFAARLRPARPHGSTGYFFLTPASRHNFKILSHASAASKSGGLCPGEGSTFGKVNPCKILVKFELQSVADLATPTEKQGYQDRLRENFVNDSNPTKRFK